MARDPFVNNVLQVVSGKGIQPTSYQQAAGSISALHGMVKIS